MSALGECIHRLGLEGDTHRLACEVLHNKTVIARDARSGRAFIVQPARPDSEEAARADSALRPHAVIDAAPDSNIESASDQPPTDSSERPTDPGPLYAESAPPGLEDVFGAFEVSFQGSKAQAGAGEPDLALSERIAANLVDTIRRFPEGVPGWQQALAVVQALVPAEAGAALRVEDDGTYCFVAVTGPHGNELQAVRLPLGTGVAGYCMKRLVSVLIADPYRDPRFFREMDKLLGYRTHALLCVPVACDGKVYGALELLNPPSGIVFRREHLARMERVADALARRIQSSSPLWRARA